VSQARAALAFFALQLALNAAWSWLFFGLRRPDLALLCIVLLWAAIVATITAFRRVRPLAGGLLLPYLVWVTFAAALNFEIWRLNR
jgi:tryptophan-rich sensory protein